MEPTATSEAYEVGAEMAFFQWGQRPANTCNGAHLGLGHNPVYGAGTGTEAGMWGARVSARLRAAGALLAL